MVASHRRVDVDVTEKRKGSLSGSTELPGRPEKGRKPAGGGGSSTAQETSRARFPENGTASPGELRMVKKKNARMEESKKTLLGGQNTFTLLKKGKRG